jgi:Tfp pilus assembly protein PilV
MTARGGYTLVEIVVATLVFTVGGLALAAGSAVIGRTMAVNGRREAATRLATSRLEQIRSSCGGAKSGTDSAGGVHLRWNVISEGSSATVVETVSYQTPSGTRSETLRASFACP